MDSIGGSAARRILLLAVCVATQIAIRALTRSGFYRRLRASWKITLALLCTQGTAFFFPVLLREINFVPCLLSSPARAFRLEAITEGAGMALGPAAAAALCFRLLPRAKSAARAGALICAIPLACYVFLALWAYRSGLMFTALLYAFGTAYGLFMVAASVREHRACAPS